MRNGKPSFICLIAILSLPGSGCVSKEFGRRISRQIDNVSEQTREVGFLSERSDSYPLEWKEALKILNERNLNLKRARERSEDILRERDEQWKNWVPRLNIYGNLNSSLSELGSLSFNDLNAAVIAPLSIPNPFTERARAFENALSYLESKDSLELTYRRQVISLYQLFSRMEKIERTRADNEEEEATSVSGGLSRIGALAVSDGSIDSLQSQLVQLLNMPGTRPLPVAESRPKVDYKNTVSKFVPGRNYGHLAVRLSAYRIEGALLRQKGIELRRWPTLSLSGSTPSLYESRNDGVQDFTDTERITLFGGLSKSYDLVGDEADNIKTARENTEYVKQYLRLQLDRDSREWNRLQKQYKELIIRERIAMERLGRIRSGKSEIAPSVELARVREAMNSLGQLQGMKEQLDLEIWTWDDDAWK